MKTLVIPCIYAQNHLDLPYKVFKEIYSIDGVEVEFLKKIGYSTALYGKNQ